MSRALKIFLYFLSFFVIVYFSVILMVRASYFIPVNANGIDFDRTYNVLYLILFGIFAVCFGLIGAYAYLSDLGKKSFKEVFKYKKKTFVFVVTFFAVGLFYYVFELLFGYIILNYNNPSLTVNNNYRSVVVNEDTSFNGLNYSSKTNNAILFAINGKTTGFYSSVISHYGNGMHQVVGNNNIIKAMLNSNVYVDKSSINVRGKYSEAIYVDDSIVNVSNSNINIYGENSVALFSENGKVVFSNSKITSNSNYVLVFRDNSVALFDNVEFNISSDTNELIYLNSTNSRVGSTITLKNIECSTPDFDFFKIDKSTSVINIEDSTFNWNSLNEYFAYLDDSSLEIHLKNSKIIGDINVDMDSSLHLYLESSSFEGDIKTINGIDLTMDDSSDVIFKNKLKVNSFTGSEESKNSLNDFIILSN